MKQAYTNIDFQGGTLALISTMDDVIKEYQAGGYVLTVRQLYYQMVARGYIENSMRSYKRLASIINDARMAGLLDWSAIEDRTRDFVRRSHWSSGPSILESCVRSYHQDQWVGQDHRVFVLVEKEALVGVLEPVCRRFDVPLLAARGYPSGTVLREFALEDLRPAIEAQQVPVILHLGDHDPSGIDMSRDLSERLCTFIDGWVSASAEQLSEEKFQRIALNMPQIEELSPPENPAKTTDSRYEGYIRRFGESSWELDALPPDYLERLLEEHITAYIQQDAWDETAAQIQAVKTKLSELAAQWEDL